MKNPAGDVPERFVRQLTEQFSPPLSPVPWHPDQWLAMCRFHAQMIWEQGFMSGMIWQDERSTTRYMLVTEEERAELIKRFGEEKP